MLQDQSGGDCFSACITPPQDGRQWLMTQTSLFASFVKSVLDVCMTPGAANPDAPACNLLAIDLVRACCPLLSRTASSTLLAAAVMSADRALTGFGNTRQSAQAQTISKLWRECILAQLYRDMGADRFVEFLSCHVSSIQVAMPQPSTEEVNEVIFSRSGNDFSNHVVIRVGRTTLRMNQYTLARLLDVGLAFNNARPKMCSIDLPSPIKVMFGPEMA